MQITSKVIDRYAILAIIDRVSSESYDGNIVVQDYAKISNNRTRIKLGTKNSYVHGSRTSVSGRHGKYLCWHGFRDVMAAILLADPNARIATGVTVYRGAKDFLDKFPDTAYQNIGSMVFPLYIAHACVDCDSRISGQYDAKLNENH